MQQVLHNCSAHKERGYQETDEGDLVDYNFAKRFCLRKTSEIAPQMGEEINCISGIKAYKNNKEQNIEGRFHRLTCHEYEPDFATVNGEFFLTA